MRLDKQRNPVRFHQRRNARKHIRGYDVTPHNIWGEPVVLVTSTATTTTLTPATIARADTQMTVTLTGTGYTTLTQVAYQAPGSTVWVPMTTTYTSATSIKTDYFTPSVTGVYKFAAVKPGELPSGTQNFTVT